MLTALENESIRFANTLGGDGDERRKNRKIYEAGAKWLLHKALEINYDPKCSKSALLVKLESFVYLPEE